MGRVKEYYQESINREQDFRDNALESEKMYNDEQEFAMIYSTFSMNGVYYTPSLVNDNAILCVGYESPDIDVFDKLCYSIFKYKLDANGMRRDFVKKFNYNERLEAEMFLRECNA